MAKLVKEDVIASLKEMSIVEVMDLVKAIEEEFGIVAASGAAAPAAAGAAADEGPSVVDITLKSFGASKVKVIKAVQAITGLGLMDAKKMVDGAPVVIKEKITPAEAEEYKNQLTEAGAEVEVK